MILDGRRIVKRKWSEWRKSIGCVTALVTLLMAPVIVSGQKDTAKPATYESFRGKAVSQTGFISTHRIDEKYFLEIPDSLLEKDILVVTRIYKAAANLRVNNGMLGYAGDQLVEKVIRFSKGTGKKIFIRKVAFSEYSADSSRNGLYRSVLNSSLFPIIAAFDIKYYRNDSSSYIIEVGDYLRGSGEFVFFDDKLWKGQFGLGGFEADKSYVSGIYTFPLNTEIRMVRTYAPGAGEAYHTTFELNCSLVTLPAEKMRPRPYDMRVGYFGRTLKDFDRNPQGVDKQEMINRWRMEPRAGEEARYLGGELVEPRKPIVYYIDPATPKKWVPWLIQGVNAWQQAFEKAGFKNAIYALEAPSDDTAWSINDARHNVIVYKPSAVQNASGPQISDPRTGEILETHINWYHNVMELLHDWYMIQAGAIDPAARKYNLEDTLMGKLIRYVCTHEVGHTLGLTHNMAASYSIPVARLRDKQWLETNCHTPSIMDYARFNYVAQPEDSVPLNSLIPRLGVYDEWAIEWGYRWFGNKTGAEEQAYLSNWMYRRIKADKRLWYGYEGLQDPRLQAEDLGDNQMVANRYGIKNLKRVMPDIITWMTDTANPVQNYQAAIRVYGRALDQYRRYLRHVTNYIGLWYTTDRPVAEDSAIYELINREKQREAVGFLNDELFHTPEWLLDRRQFSLFSRLPMMQLIKLQEEILDKILTGDRLNWLSMSEALSPGKGYPPALFLQDLKQGIWELPGSGKAVDIYRRNLQKAYVKKLTSLITAPGTGEKPTADYLLTTAFDLRAIIKAHMRQLDKELITAQAKTSDVMTNLHFREVRDMIGKALQKSRNTAD